MLTAHNKRFGFPRLRVILLSWNQLCLQVLPYPSSSTPGKLELKEPSQKKDNILSTAIAVIKSVCVSDQKSHVFSSIQKLWQDSFLAFK